MFETIVALATPPIKSALGIIRLSGDDCFKVVSKVFSKDLTKINKREIVFGYILDNRKEVDQVVLLTYVAPHSFTGENAVEIISHGSPLIENQIITLLLNNGARMATNGEFSSRAYLNGRIDLVQAEAINDMINSTTMEAKDLSMLALKGENSKLFKPIKEEIAEILSAIEVNIDYPEYEDIEVANKDKVIAIVDELIPQIDVLVEDGQKAKIINEGVKVALVGKPNVGKSSLLNAFLGEDRAIVTDIAGTTRDVVEGHVNIDGVVLHLYDTAGIRDSEDKIESIGIEKSKKTIKEADIVVVLLDSSNELDDEDKQILEYTKEYNPIVVYNKDDKNTSNNLSISALNNQIQPLIDVIKQRIGLDEKSFSTPALNNTRQLGLLSKAKESLLKAKEDALNDLTVDLISVSLLDAYSSILEILGETNQVDLSKEIFSRFCVGK